MIVELPVPCPGFAPLQMQRYAAYITTGMRPARQVVQMFDKCMSTSVDCALFVLSLECVCVLTVAAHDMSMNATHMNMTRRIALAVTLMIHGSMMP